ncbi:MAG: DUF2203 domain-containing protein [Deltaproteobacteria bacterium]|nr:DUF2203 domain-containing protein [Deltaproteobacteria bacterium]
MPQRTFSPSEVQGLIPSLELLVGRLMVLHAEIRATTAQPQLERLQADADALVTRIEELGGELKDLERGLVDFPCRRGSEIVLLCWQFGEKRLTHWHGVDEGFAGRKPLDGVPVEREAELLN